MNAAAAAPVLAAYIGDSDREQFVIAMVTVRRTLIGLHTVSVACLTSSLVHSARCSSPPSWPAAPALLLAHTPPSGDPEPSAEDVALTRRLASAGTLLGIEVLDHLVLRRSRPLRQPRRARRVVDPFPTASLRLLPPPCPRLSKPPAFAPRCRAGAGLPHRRSLE